MEPHIHIVLEIGVDRIVQLVGIPLLLDRGQHADDALADLPLQSLRARRSFQQRLAQLHTRNQNLVLQKLALRWIVNSSNQLRQATAHLIHHFLILFLTRFHVSSHYAYRSS